MHVSTKIAAIQMCSSDTVEENLKTADDLMQEGIQQGAKIVVLPENFAFMGKNEQDKLRIAEHSQKGPIQAHLSNFARKHKVWVVAGTIPILAPDNRVYAASLVFDSEGQIIARYDKIHLFDVQVQAEKKSDKPAYEEYQESKTICPGDAKNQVVVDSPLGKLGLSVCFDLRFPELYRQLLSLGSEILLIPSAFTYVTGFAHWESLLRARAIENLSYVVAPNQSGTHANGRKTFGHSMIIDPWGKILASLEEEEGVIVAEINLLYLQDIRKRFPVSQLRRL